MSWFVENWSLVVAGGAAIAVTAVCVYRFLKLPKEEQIKNVKEWLLLAVTEAEATLGGGTGQLKLRYVYDMFAAKFPWVCKMISFDTFSTWVDEALEEMRNMLESNEAAKALVEGMK